MCSPIVSVSLIKKQIYDIFIISGDIAIGKSSRGTLYIYILTILAPVYIGGRRVSSEFDRFLVE